MKISRYLLILTASMLVLTLPVPGMAQTPLKMRIITEAGDMITTGDAVIKGYYMNSSDGTLTIVVADGIKFGFSPAEPSISITAGTNCTISESGSVIATAGKTFSFTASSNNPAASITASVLPAGNGTQPTFVNNVFQWTTGDSDAGIYLAVLKANAPPPSPASTEIIVVIKIAPTGQFTLAVSENPPGAGTVSGGGSYGPGQNVTISASAATGYRFDSWSGDYAGAANPATFVIDGNTSVIANFAVENACAHSECKSGAALADGCSPCAATVCEENPSCCTNRWTLTCVREAKRLCTSTCP